MKSILLVEDETLLREVIADSLRLFDVRCVVHAVESGARALELLGSQTFDLAIFDLLLPEVDGLTLLSYLRERGSKTPVIVITGRGAPGLEGLVRSLGAKMFIKKPFDLNVLLVTVERFLLVGDDLAENRIQGFSLQAFLQLMELDGKTSLIRVLATDEREGQLRFFNGKLVSALTPTRAGEGAVLEILGWHEPEIRVSSIAKPMAPNVSASLASLLVQSCRDQDELRESPFSTSLRV